MNPVGDPGYDCLLLDLDGTVFRGSEAVPGVIDHLSASPLDCVFITNNASKSPADAAEHLRSLGFEARPEMVVTSAGAAVTLAAETSAPGTRVLVVGHPSFEDLAREAGLEVVSTADDDPEIVFQGLSRELTWAQLAEGCLAIRAGARWIASNTDTTLPTERGLLPGNGSLVAALVAATGRSPEVAGKPGPAMLRQAAERAGATRPLVVGDRLDTDIRGATAAGLDSLFVLTGVSTLDDALTAAPDSRPTLLAADAARLADGPETLRIGPDPRVGAMVEGDLLVVDAGTVTGVELARAVLAGGWNAGVTAVCGVDARSGGALAEAGFTVAGAAVADSETASRAGVDPGDRDA